MASRKPRIAAFDRRAQLLEVARSIFAQRGFRGTTTKQIAERAKVNEAILFRHFRNKEVLYWAVLDEMVRGTPGRHQLENAIAGPLRDATPAIEERIFTELARGILARSRNDHGFNRLLLFSALENHRLSRKFFKVYIAEYCQVLAAYIRTRIRSGAFLHTDALLAARSFIGMVYYHYLAQEILGGSSFRKFSDMHAAKTIAQIWLGGVRQPTARSRSKA